MKIVLCVCVLLLLSEMLKAQTSFRDSVQNIWNARFTRIIKGKANTDSSYEGFVFSKKTHELLAATSYQKGDGVSNFIHYYFIDNTLVWFKVMIQYPANRKEKGYVEYY